MAKTKISEYSSTANNNTDINSINLAEGMAPSLVNNAIRTLMAQLKNFQDGSAGDNVTVGGNLSVTGTSTLTGTLTATAGLSGPLTSSSATITGGTINGAVIGGSSAQAITGTTVTASTGFVGGLTGNVTGNTTGTHTGAVTGNVTGNLTGNVSGNVTTATGTSTFNNVTIDGTLDMSSGTVGTITGLATPTNASDAATKGYVDTADALKLNLTGGTMSGAIAMGTNKITGLGTPTADADAVTKSYVDAIAQGIDAKASVVAASTANLTLSGAQTIDGVSVIAGNRVLVKDQTTASDNGIYLCASGSWTRTTDADTYAELVAAYTFVEGGTVNANNGFICTIPTSGTLGSTSITFAQFSGAGQVVAGTGMSKTGNTLNVNTASSARIVVSADEIDLATTGVTASTYKSVTVDTFAGFTRISKQMLRDLPFMQSYLPSELQESYFRDEDNKFINTLMSQTAAYSTSASVYAEKLVEWVSVLLSRDYDPNGIVTTAANWATLLTTKPSDYSVPQAVTVTPDGTVAVAGVPVYMLNGMTGTKTFVGDWSRLKIVQASGLAVNFFEQDADNVTKNLITVRAEADVALANLRPDAFLYV